MCRNLCRLCGRESMVDTALKLFERKNNILLYQLKEVIGVMLKNSCGLPKLVCSSCIKSLKEAFQFRENVLKAQALLKIKLAKVKKGQHKNTVIEDTEFVQVCYVKDEKDQRAADINNAEEKEISFNDSQTAYKKEEPQIDNYTCERNALEISSNEENSLEEVKSTYRPENNEGNKASTTTNSFNNNDVGHFSEVSSEIDGGDAVYEPLPLSRKKNIRPRSTHIKVKTKKQIGVGKVTKVVSSPKDNKSRKRRKDAEEHPSVFICDQCGNHFTCRHHFKLHLRRHTGDKQCACELCPDKFFTSSELRRHMRKHTGERPFACKYCERRFTDYSTRIKHERTHTNERPFMCSQCGKSFTTSYILKNHMLTHTGERHFKCDVCDKAFTRRTHLVVHFRSIMHKQAVEKEKQLSLQESKTRLIASTSISSFLV